ncbi:heavy metal translocating P-type ATPase [Sediminicoccus sp. KRV36]|uniref:heavy metal translocating P-type ATPase n=1 Tax=Sediminicoccus sp. KRV36 TaxID=3133721 RepID=UPI00200C150C|nr:heavy metal translocating P-type ATPase [Sediminicoccus rosea]UPY38862.1 heavy metal translocating P-type ATPase [Sediminicoccus rosea]
MSGTQAKRVKLDLGILLPDAPGEADACVWRLISALNGHDGIDQVHVVPASGDHPAQLCIHYDPAVASLARVRDIAQSTGAQLTERFGHVLWDVEGLRDERRARTVTDLLSRLPGVMEADASPAGPVRIEFDRIATSEAALRQALAEMGVRHHDDAAHAEHEHDHGGPLGTNSELIFALLSGALLIAGYLASWLTDAPAWLPVALYLGAYGFGGYYTLREALDTIRLGRFEIDTLMLVAAAGAAALDKWAEGALLLFLFSIGHALEHYAMGRARRAIAALAELAPPTAELRRDGAVREVPVAELVIGDTIILRPNTRIPADGFVTQGESSVDQAPITGESVPVDKRAVEDTARAALRPEGLLAENRVYAGTINGAGALEVQVSRLAADSSLARLVRMVNEAEAQKSPTQRFTDRFERIFVPVVLAAVLMLLLAFVVLDESFGESFYRAMAVLVAASPCALAISTPSAVLSGIARAARGGVLVKGGGPLENLGKLGAIAFDKTGTLTEGKPRVTDVLPASGVDARELLMVAISVEALSDHPLAAAVLRDGRAQLGTSVTVPEATELRSITGRGLAARIGDDAVFVGKAALFAEIEGPPVTPEVQAMIAGLEHGGRTTMIVRRGERYLGAIGLMDTPRAAAAGVIQQLRKLGISRMVMMSGDNRRVAEAVAQQVGLDEAWGDLMPEDKVAAIQRFRAAQEVAMVGDGVNDAPAMAHATVGIAMGAAGSDVALETADVALMGDDLTRLPFVIGLSRSTNRVIRQNLWISLGMVAVLVPATLFGLQLGAAVVFHEGSTLLVVANALRLLAYRDPSETWLRGPGSVPLARS